MASTVTELMRRRLEYQAKIDEYEGVVFGAGFSASILERVFVATPFLEIPSNCTSITIHFTNIVNKGMYGPRHILYNANKGFVSYWNQTNYASEFTKTMTAGAYAYLRVTLDCDLIDDSFVRDNTNNQYLWKGKNVT